MYLLSIGLHISLLEVSSEPMEVLVIRQQGVGLSTVEVAVPDAQQSKDHWHLQSKIRTGKATGN